MTISKTPEILRTVAQVRQWRQSSLSPNSPTVGFVPTMGALHAGHLSLIRSSLQHNDRTIISIFVNPSQFAPHEDLDAYPRTLDTDLQLIRDTFGGLSRGVDAVFVPKITEIYPSGINLDVTQQRGAFVSVLGCLEQLEGVTRPQFFRGVATVVTKLINVVMPTNIYFGQKDAQQCVVIKNLVKDLLIPTRVNVLPTLRELNGLAMSSRNEYLSDDMRLRSAVIYEALRTGEEYYESVKGKGEKVKASEILEKIRPVIASDKDFEIEYISINHPETLDELEFVEPGVGALVSTAVKVPKENSNEKARLIDNIILH
ncbi:Pantoate--beta-alanine ligase [Candida viswanathii]|uniref:Pantoate--beta-alanine ligase n=1 Tax=Candida viswanathii TaxID=5486 RepID=A0A367Y0Z5_9ASCO|nr:Pantoate--beta-alanine ligase [Candida viswanathii]